MTYSVYQHWDPLKVMAVGRSYPPEFYDYIKNEKVRKVFYKIAEETEEDYQKLTNLLESFNVDVFRMPIDNLLDQAKRQISKGENIVPPYVMQPRDQSVMIGETFYCSRDNAYAPLREKVASQGNIIKTNTDFDTGFRWNNQYNYLNGAQLSRLGKDLYIGSLERVPLNKRGEVKDTQVVLKNELSDYRVTFVETDGHTDGCFCPVVPGLILSIVGPYHFKETFPDWEVVYLANESWGKVKSFLDLKQKNAGKWWVPGEELNQDFTDYVETWMNKWVGYVEESVFDVNMIVIDKKHVIVNGYNEKVFDAFSRHGITPHVCNFRHRYFWDGGLHCITSDLHREGVREDYFPDRNQ
jgi:N-dimethylarginine dimethylaminohydrolase